ncbi:Acetyltransferase (GNAT) family protein [Cohaesibacter sp. ES.047]|uniref:GNAT family N-acetyltransferase n=1 Tax=Cohaesibacter sp. ES.047 TaxID=1798205 RepID=UPI000BC0E32E|nr:GNAT family N-acetyltransferase [Cohaesibacter sp. ES.047]SNY92106.1 Acetyltransferase (GNAT) family protein [Cohaesibacter sp. ES.047]
MAISFRLAKAQQLQEIRALYLKNMAYIGERMGVGQPAHAFSHLDQFLANRNLYVATNEDGTAIGAAAMSEVDNALYLDYLVIGKDWQRQGVGCFILSELELIAESRELPFLRLHTPEVMTELVDYYNVRGFTETHRAEPDHGRDKILRVYFQKAISGSDLRMDPEHEHDRLLA